ncbi:MAG: chromosomal replication initiator protein DnaA [Candidatus Methanosuratincola sp.]|jgi:chromosomal replication initiator protein
MKAKPLSAAYAVDDSSGARLGSKDAVIWNDVVEGIRKKVSPEIIFWFEDLSIASQTEDSITLCAKSPFEREWVKENFLDLISSTLFELRGRRYDIHLTSRDESEPEREPQNQPTERRSVYTGTLIPSYTFERFVVGPSNQFAHAASIAVARNPGHSYNPLFIYGGVGLGKTHLINAIGNYVIKHRTTPQARVCSISAEHFTNQVINSIKTGRMEELRNQYRFGCDVLMIDDIQFIAGKESTQEEFFHTFNTLYESKKQIVLTSDKTPKDMPQIEERLRSRFEWGIITDIQPPEVETKVAILENLAEEREISLPKSVALFIAENINSNIRELEGTLINISAYAKLLKTEITIDLAKDVLKNIVKELPSKAISIEAIQKQVAAFFGVKVQELKSDKKLKTIAVPRQIAMYLARRYTGSSFPEIGDKFGGKDHSTVIHAVRKIEAMVEADPSFRNTVNAVMAKIDEQRG